MVNGDYSDVDPEIKSLFDKPLFDLENCMAIKDSMQSDLADTSNSNDLMDLFYYYVKLKDILNEYQATVEKINDIDENSLSVSDIAYASLIAWRVEELELE